MIFILCLIALTILCEVDWSWACRWIGHRPRMSGRIEDEIRNCDEFDARPHYDYLGDGTTTNTCERCGKVLWTYWPKWKFRFENEYQYMKEEWGGIE